MLYSALVRFQDTIMGRRAVVEPDGRSGPIAPFICPSSWTARARLPKSCRCYRPGMDPLVAASFHNQQCSRLCQLPDELLLTVMQQLDLLTIQCLRRACRLFLRLYSSPEFSNSHNPGARNYSYSYGWLNPWQQPSVKQWPVDQLPPLLARDIGRYCKDCRGARYSRSWQKRAARLTTETLHCSGCQFDHPRAVFSASQRQSPNSASRVCIGHEGFVRVCQHRVIKWDEIAPIALRLSEFDTGSAGLAARIYLPPCNDSSHIPKHHKSISSYEGFANLFPSISIVGNKKRNINLEIEWIGHLDLPELSSRRRLTAELMHQKLTQELRPGVAEYIAPEQPPGRLPEMLCLDANRCSCLQYPGREQLDRSWSLMPAQEIGFSTCRTDATQKLGFATHRASLITTGLSNNGTSWLEVKMKSCPASKKCLQVEYKRTITILPFGFVSGWRGCVNVGWWQALDPGSYNLTKDDEGFGLFWCRQKGCLNYYRYLRRPFARYYPYAHSDCSASCPAS